MLCSELHTYVLTPMLPFVCSCMIYILLYIYNYYNIYILCLYVDDTTKMTAYKHSTKAYTVGAVWCRRRHAFCYNMEFMDRHCSVFVEHHNPLSYRDQMDDLCSVWDTCNAIFPNSLHMLARFLVNRLVVLHNCILIRKWHKHIDTERTKRMKQTK